MTTTTDFETQLKSILGGKRIQNCSNEVRRAYNDFFGTHHPNADIRENHTQRTERRETLGKQVRERLIKEKQFEIFTLAVLKEMCKEKKLKGYSKLKKDELVVLLKK
jgi:hypothetical protein